MKTPEEIKKGLGCCANEDGECTLCPYRCGNGVQCIAKKSEDALAYIRQLEQIVADFTERTAQLEAQRGKDINVPRWISTEDRLPDTEDNVLVIASGQPTERVRMERAYLLASYIMDECWIVDGWEEWENPTVHCWMPMPEPPKEE